MFASEVYVERRNQLRARVKSGLILLLCNQESPRNYPANCFQYRQDSTFLYYTGLHHPDLALLLDADSGQDILFGDDLTLDDVIWMGPQPTVAARAATAGIATTRPLGQLAALLAASTGRPVHFLPPYRAENAMRLEELLGPRATAARRHASLPLIQAVVAARSVKSAAEIAEIDAAFDIAAEMYAAALPLARPGGLESDLVAAMEEVVERRGSTFPFPPSLTINGQPLHNHYHGNRLEAGRLMIVDAGCESPAGYATDTTRTVPVGGSFTGLQKDLYELVLRMQREAIAGVRPGVPYRDLHLLASRVLVDGLQGLGLMRGDAAEAVAAGAHAMFFPHGLGHMMGLDVHDLEDLGENHVGYGDGFTRSEQFGLAYLRLAKPLQPGYVLTVEPGIYFIPDLIDLWTRERRHSGFINYDKVQPLRAFGGIRIEDDVVVTASGGRVLGKPIAKTPAEIAALFH
jgi:Xaa-Pro aminopeptidase